LDKKYISLVADDEFGIIHISNFRPVKNTKNVIEIFYKISRKIKSKLILVGEGPDIGFAKEMVKKLGVEDKVFFLGRKDNIIPLLNSADLYLLPSKSESFGVSALEALSCGLPVIGTEIGGLKEVVINGYCGFLFPPEKTEEMANCAIDLLSSHDMLREFSRNARERALDFDSKKIVQKYIELYKKVIEE
jgi:N-acetyl-alpha-D-glucosaminyl L-malate synthase BshA